MSIIQELFPGRLQKTFMCLESYLHQIQEIRVRVNTPVIIRMQGKEYAVSCDGQLTSALSKGFVISSKDMEESILHICHSSIYAYEEEIRRGYITITGGHRVGITGQVVLNDNGQVKTIKNISFINIRIAHEVIGAATNVLPYIYQGNRVNNTLIVSPPGFGKTTLLRDMVRQVSNGNGYGKGRNCCIIDERSELAGSYKGMPQLDVGMRTDVLDGCPKSIGMMMVIRSMCPQVVAVDELGSREDMDAVFAVMHSGSSIFATIHGDSTESLKEKSFLKQVMKERVFSRYIVIQNDWHDIKIFNGELEKC